MRWWKNASTGIVFGESYIRFTSSASRIQMSQSCFQNWTLTQHTQEWACHLSWLVGPLAYILCRLPFRVSPAAGIFSLLSDFVVDMANTSFEDPTWSPDTLNSPLAEALLSPVYLSGEFRIAWPLLVDIKAKPLSAESFIDDMVIVCTHSAVHGVKISRYQGSNWTYEYTSTGIISYR